MSHGKGRLAGFVSVVAIAGALHVASSQTVASQPVYQPAPQPAPASAAPGALSGDQVQLLQAALADAELHGFRSNEFGQRDIARLLDAGDAASRAQGEARLRRAIVAYAAAQRGGRLPASAFVDDWTVRPAAYDAQSDFAFALSQNRLEQWLASLAPPFERYRKLQTALGQYRVIQQKGGWGRIPEGAALKPGMTDPRVVALRRRLAAENAPGAIEMTSPTYDAALVSAVQRAQARLGLGTDGVVGGATLASLNAPVDARIAQIAANMERWRWMPRAFPRTRVEVNIPAQHLDAYADGRSVESMRVAVGANATRTPMIYSQIHSVVLNPPWNVPQGIAAKELAPKGGDYLARNGYRWVSDGSGGSRLQQRPGPGNSLGRLKFDFENPFAVYLHDTNSKAVFERDARAVSHGCIRVERPMDLARLLLESDPAWNAGRIDASLDSMETVRARVQQPWSVMILYWTVFVDDNGVVNFRNDVYGWDADLTERLSAGRISA